MQTHAIYGPPGCGKTTEMLNRLEQAKAVYGAENISFLSFTKAAAAEALKRLNITKSEKISTIHSLMFRLTRCSVPAVIDTHKLKKFGEKTGFIFRGMVNDTGEQMELGDQYMNILSKAVNRQTSLKEEYHESDRPGDWNGFEFFCRAYREFKLQNGYVDFNDMLVRYVQQPSDHGASVLFIDEAQDLSNLQWMVIDDMLKFKRVQEVHIAGDDDQAIYEWSGANTHGMAQFEERYEAHRTILSQSWRVPVAIHTKAMEITSRIANRVEKEYKPRNEQGLIRRMSHFDPTSFKPGEDVMILCRNYVTRKELEDELIRRRIPYKNDGGMPGLFDSRIAHGIRAFVRFQAGDAITKTDLNKIYAVADDRTRREIDLKEFTPMLRRGFMRSLLIPPTLVDFYRDADLTVEPTIRLSTIHAAKGREADHVVLNTGLTAKTWNDIDKNPDAEARVWYVGVTRSRQTLDILEGDMAYGI
jgi:DNA helicase-2/ATP-dependent DNA helicase PcrA